MRVSDQDRMSVISIGMLTAENHFVPVGHAFGVVLEEGGLRFVHIVTARRIIESIPGDVVVLRINRKPGGAVLVRAEKHSWYAHPQNEPGNPIDIAVFPFELPSGIKRSDLDVVFVPPDGLLRGKTAETLGVGAGEPIFAVGTFNVRSGGGGVLIVRTGSIAALRDLKRPIASTRGPVDAHLVEIGSAAGWTGAPVFVQLAAERVVNERVVRTAQSGARSSLLLGMMHGPLETKADAAVEESEKVFAEIGGPELGAGLALVVPVDKIVETLGHPALAEWRQKNFPGAKSQEKEAG